jgi:hypothetical protein
LQAPVQGTAAEAERFGGAISVAFKSRQGFLDQQTLGIFKAHFFKLRRHLCAGLVCNARSIALTVLSELINTARSIMWSNSRTFPGQEYFS